MALAVFGSVGRGTPQPDSDVDLLLFIPTEQYGGDEAARLARIGSSSPGPGLQGLC